MGEESGLLFPFGGIPGENCKTSICFSLKIPSGKDWVGLCQSCKSLYILQGLFICRKMEVLSYYALVYYALLVPLKEGRF